MHFAGVVQVTRLSKERHIVRKAACGADHTAVITEDTQHHSIDPPHIIA